VDGHRVGLHDDGDDGHVARQLSHVAVWLVGVRVQCSSRRARADASKPSTALLLQQGAKARPGGQYTTGGWG
jgi:hypothetical protein